MVSWPTLRSSLRAPSLVVEGVCRIPINGAGFRPIEVTAPDAALVSSCPRAVHWTSPFRRCPSRVVGQRAIGSQPKSLVQRGPTAIEPATIDRQVSGAGVRPAARAAA